MPPPYPARFLSFVEEKTTAAAAAPLPPYVTEFDDATGTTTAVGNDWTRQVFGGDFHLSPTSDPSRPACSLVFVQSRDGNTGAANPTMLGGGQTDKHLIYEGLSQVAADAVLSGAGTILGGDILFAVWHPELVRLRLSLGKPRYPVQVVATLRGLNLDDHLLFNVPDIPACLLTVEAGEARMREAIARRPWVQAMVMSNPGDIAAAFRWLRASGIARVSAVGGRHVARQLVDAGLVQDLYLTTSPKAGGEPGTPIYPRPLPTRTLLRKHGTGPEHGVIFEHLVLTGPP